MFTGIEAPAANSAAGRVRALETESAFTAAARVQERRAAGLPVFDLSIGEPSEPPSPSIVEAAARALRDEPVRYTPPAGLPLLREAIASERTARGAPCSAADVFVTPGAKQALLHAVLATVEPGAEVLLPDPGFRPWISQVHLAGGRPCAYPLTGPTGGPTADAIAEHVTRRTRVLLLNAPGNPAGGAATARELERIAELARAHGLVVITDDIYARLWYGDGESAPLLADAAGALIAVDGFSKAWSMTGFRLGAVVAPARYHVALERLAVATHSCVPGFVQAAGVAALAEAPERLRARVARLRVSRDAGAVAFSRIPGVHCAPPDGGLYLFPDCRALLAALDTSDTALAQRLLTEHGIAVLAGSDFGPGGAGHLRLSLAATRSALDAAAAALDHISSTVLS
ncbi:MAG TPA: aminotransferase class I/II-fold pyridoxal phosphate-dependent enzyme [Gemmatimonadales bacterium]|nr:aminotransferase class I/II-fold pyridoxal phosphate-dependent enzyme [Gemmatimonadales bacterium]